MNLSAEFISPFKSIDRKIIPIVIFLNIFPFSLEPKQVFEPKQLTEPKQAMEPKQAFEGPEVEILHEQYRTVQDELSEGIERLEQVVEKLTPFIPTEQRPVLKHRTRTNRR